MSNMRKPGIHVECNEGYQGGAEPSRFFFGNREVTVSEILDRWLDPSHRYFKLRGHDNALYILRYDAILDSWEVILYDSGQYAPSRLSST